MREHRDGVVILREHVRSQLPWAAIGGPIEQSLLTSWGEGGGGTRGKSLGEIEMQFPHDHDAREYCAAREISGAESRESREREREKGEVGDGRS